MLDKKCLFNVYFLFNVTWSSKTRYINSKKSCYRKFGRQSVLTRVCKLCIERIVFYKNRNKKYTVQITSRFETESRTHKGNQRREPFFLSS